MAFYDRLIDGLLLAGLAPYLTLYHWDLPQALQDKGGWYSRDTALRFAEYAGQMATAFGDRVRYWTTLNEPWTFCWSGHASGEDAPGMADGVKGGLCASHHALLAHGLAVPVIRAAAKEASVGIVLDLNVAEPASAAPGDVAAARHFDGAQNRWYLDAIFKGSYPADILALCTAQLPEIRPGDAAIIAAPVDYLGVNIYRRSVMQAGGEWPPLNFARVNPPGDYSAVGYEIWPKCMHDVLTYVHKNYGPQAIYISENGLATPREALDENAEIVDLRRAAYYVDHIEQMDLARRDGVPVRGYFAWTLIDNFEWTYGYAVPFGIVHVDFATSSAARNFRLKPTARSSAPSAEGGPPGSDRPQMSRQRRGHAGPVRSGRHGFRPYRRLDTSLGNAGRCRSRGQLARHGPAHQRIKASSAPRSAHANSRWPDTAGCRLPRLPSHARSGRRSRAVLREA